MDAYAHRPFLLGVAYRMLGEREAAEDAVQETFLRWHRAAPDDVANVRAWLLRTLTRLAIDRLRALKRERLFYEGPWLPEPWVGGIDIDDDPPRAEIADSLKLAFLLILERLSPAERAAFLLHDVFDLDYGEVAATLERSEVACRKLVSRARARLGGEALAGDRAEDSAERLLAAFLAATERGDIEGLKAKLSADCELWSDGGGKASAARNVLVGPERVAAFMIGLGSKFPADGALSLTRLNGVPAVLLRQSGVLTTAITLDVAGGKIRRVLTWRNPEKLALISDDAAGSNP